MHSFIAKLEIHPEEKKTFVKFITCTFTHPFRKLIIDLNLSIFPK